LKIYWFEMGRSFGPSLAWFGITAKDFDDALLLLAKAAEQVYRVEFNAEMIESWKEIEHVDELDQNHVVPNMGLILRRGVWFPNVSGVT
jgi:hypothetical protein